jgi:hypothetical protein
MEIENYFLSLSTSVALIIFGASGVSVRSGLAKTNSRFHVVPGGQQVCMINVSVGAFWLFTRYDTSEGSTIFVSVTV